MATETYFLPGYGIVVDAGDGDEYFLPGYGIVKQNQAGEEDTGFVWGTHIIRRRRRNSN